MRRIGMRSTTVVGIAAALVLAGCSAAEDGGDVRPVRMAVQEEYSAYLMHVAEEQGCLEEKGLGSVETTQFTSLPALLTAVGDGQLDFGMQTVTGLWGYNQTAADPLLVFSNFGNLTEWYASDDSGVEPAAEVGWEESVRAWAGKKVGVPVLGGIMDKNLRYLLERAGLDPVADVDVVAVGSQAAANQAFKQGLVDVIGVTSSTAGLIEDEGTGELVLDDTTGPPELAGNITGAYFAPKSRIDADAERYSAIADCMDEAREFATDPGNRDAAVEVLASVVGLPSAVAEAVWEIDREGIAGGAVDREVFDKTVDTLEATGALTGPRPNYEQLVATAIADR